MCSRRTTAPSDFDTTLCATTTTSPSRTCEASAPARSNPAPISGRPPTASALSIAHGRQVLGGVHVEREGRDLLDDPRHAGAVRELGVALAAAHPERGR